MSATKVIVLALAAGLLAAPAAFAQDPVADLARNVAAVIAPGPEGRILVVEEAHGASNIKSLAVGEDYAGWRIEYIGPDAVRLTRAGETRIVRILGRAQAAAEAPRLSPVAPFTSGAAPQSQRTIAELHRGAVPLEALLGDAGASAFSPDTAFILPAQAQQLPQTVTLGDPLGATSEPLEVDLSAPPVLTPEIEAELRRSLGIR